MDNQKYADRPTKKIFHKLPKGKTESAKLGNANIILILK